MNKAELKEILKPLIKECIKESLFEEGVLSGVVAEVARGMSSANIVTESQHSQARERQEADRLEREEFLEKDRQMRIKRLNESMKTNLNEVDVFENTSPIIPESSGEGQYGALAGVPADDAGVDITGILNLAGDGWKRMI